MKRILFLILLAAGLMTQSIHAATVDYFLKLEGIDGESTDDRHKSTIEVYSFHWGITQSGGTLEGSGGGGGAGKVVFQDLHMSTKVSKASPKLMLACATGQHIPSVVFFIHRPGGDTQDYIKVTLENVLVSSYQTSGSAGDSIPTDQFSLNFEKIKFEYTAQDSSKTSGEDTRPTVTQ
jgi:type VI secretion system secreted protein Hcp